MIDEPLVRAGGQYGANCLLLRGEPRKRVGIGGAGLQRDPRPRLARQLHRVGIEQIAIDAIILRRRIDRRDGHGRLLIGHQDTLPAAVGTHRILGAVVDAAVCGNRDRHVGGRRDGDAAAVGADRAEIITFGKLGPFGLRRIGRIAFDRVERRMRIGPRRKEQRREQHQRGPGAPRDLGAAHILLIVEDQRRPGAERADHEQHPGERHAVLTRGHRRFLGARGLEVMVELRRFVARGIGLRQRAGIGFQRGAVAGVGLGHRQARRSDARETLSGVAKEARHLAARDREGEGRIAVVGAGDEGVDADDAPATVDERSARIAARDLRRVDIGGDALDRLGVRQIALASHRAARGDIIGRALRGRKVDIARIAERDDLGPCLERPRIDDRGGHAPLGHFDERQVALGIDRDQLAGIAFLPFGGDDAERDIVRIFGRRFDDMGVGEDAGRRNGDAAAMPEADDFAIDHRYGDDADDAARNRADIVGSAGRNREGDEGKQGGEEECEKTGHGREPSRCAREGKLEVGAPHDQPCPGAADQNGDRARRQHYGHGGSHRGPAPRAGAQIEFGHAERQQRVGESQEDVERAVHRRADPRAAGRDAPGHIADAHEPDCARHREQA